MAKIDSWAIKCELSHLITQIDRTLRLTMQDLSRTEKEQSEAVLDIINFLELAKRMAMRAQEEAEKLS